MKHLRNQKLIRFEQEKAFDGKRFHQIYRYNVRDVWPLITATQLDT